MDLRQHFQFSASKSTGISFDLMNGQVDFHEADTTVTLRGLSRQEILSGVEMLLGQAHWYEDTRDQLEKIIAKATEAIRKIEESQLKKKQAALKAAEDAAIKAVTEPAQA